MTFPQVTIGLDVGDRHSQVFGVDEEGEVIDSSQGSDPLTYLHGTGNIIPGLESELTGKAVGATAQDNGLGREFFRDRQNGIIDQVRELAVIKPFRHWQIARPTHATIISRAAVWPAFGGESLQRWLRCQGGE